MVNDHGFSSYRDVMEGQRWCGLLDTNPLVIREWVRRYGFDLVRATVLEGQQKEQNGKIRKSLFGWVRATLKAKHTVQVRRSY